MSDIYSKLYMTCLRARASLEGEEYFRIWGQLQKEQWLTPEKIESLQIERLKKMVEHATNNSKYYRQAFSAAGVSIDDIRSPADLQKLPLLTRKDLQSNYREMLCTRDLNGVYADSSGGSTGNPVNFYHGRRYKDYAGAMELLFLSWHGLSHGVRTAAFWGADRDIKDWSFKERWRLRLQRMKILNSFDVDEQKLDTFLSEITKFRPEYIIGYASSLDLAAKYINCTGRFKIRPKAIRSSAETLYSSQRSEIEKAFEAPVYNFYGSREVNNLAAQCPKKGGMHIFASGRIIEIVDENGRQLPPGENGHIAVTDLTDLDFPFIRYLNGDMGIRRVGRCPCHRGYPLLENITGRSSDIICFGGRYIHGEYFTHLFYGRPDVRQFQVVQESANSLVVKIVTDNKDIDTVRIKEKIKERVGDEVGVDIILVDNIPLLKSGKYRFTINNAASVR